MRYKAYPSYKPSGVEWLGEVPGHWEVKRLRYVCRFAYGDSLASEDREDGEVPVYGSNGPVGSHIAANTRRPAIVIGRKGSHGKVNFSAREVFAIDTTYLIDDRYTTNDLRWLFYTLGALGLDAVSKDSAVPGLAREDAYAYLVTTPSFSEQYVIADFLDAQTAKLDTLVAKKRALIEKLKEKRTALISRTVTRGLPPDDARAAGLDPHPKLKSSGIDWLGDVPEQWVVTRLGYVVSKVGSGKTPRGGAETYQSEGVLLIRSQNVYDGGLRLADAVFIDDVIDEDMASTRVEAEDVLLNITGASLGRCAIVPRNLPRANVNQHVCIVRTEPHKALPRFVQRVISSEGVQSQIFSFESGSSREGLNFHQVRGLVLALPRLFEQKIIADYLDRETAKIDQMVAKVETAIERLQEYRTALITAAVTGKIDVRGHGAGSGVTATATSKVRMRV